MIDEARWEEKRRARRTGVLSWKLRLTGTLGDAIPSLVIRRGDSHHK